MSRTPTLRIGDWLVEPDLNRISGPAGEALLMPKAMSVLVYLAERPGQVVSAEELIDAIWDGRPMGDNPVYKCISELRTVLGDDRRAPAYIATVPTKGHRLVAPVTRVEAEAGAGIDDRPGVEEIPGRSSDGRRWLAWLGVIVAAGMLVALYLGDRERSPITNEVTAVSPVDDPPSIAVLPFANLSPDAGQDYFADGLTEELITQLSLVQGLRVIGRTSSFAFKGRNEDLRTIGQVLGVNHVLEGSVRKAGNRVRVTAQLINPVDGSHLWTKSYERSLDDSVTLQEEIAKTVAAALRLTIEARIVQKGGTRNFEAYDAYLTGLAAVGKGGADNVLVSIAAFRQAVDIDPGFITAWEALAVACQQANIDVPDRRVEWQEQLADAEQRIMERAPDRPLLIFQAAQRAASRGELVEAERLYQSMQAMKTTRLPLYGSYGAFLLNVGRPRDALTQFMRVANNEPLDLGPSLWVQIALELAGDFKGAEQEYQRSLELSENTAPVRTMALFRAMGERDIAAVRRELQAQIEVGSLTRPLNQAMSRYLDEPDVALAELHRYLDDPKTMNSSIAVMAIAAWAGYFGEPELALQAMQRLPSLVGNAFNWNIWRPVQSDMRRLPGFKTLVQQWGLVDYWRTSGNWGHFCRPVGADDFECDLGAAGG